MGSQRRGEKRKKQTGKEQAGTSQHNQEKPCGFAVLPYIKGVSERLARVFRKRNINLYSKAGRTIRNLVVGPKDPLETQEQCGVIYEFGCESCEQTYVGETGRSLGERKISQ